MSLHAQRLASHCDWDRPLIKPWHVVTNAKALVEKDGQIRQALTRGATHVWVRYIGGKLIINVYALGGEEPRVAVDPSIEGDGFWFAQTAVGLYHCLPIKGGLPKTLLTMLANVDY